MDHAKKIILSPPATNAQDLDSQLDRAIDSIMRQKIPDDKKLALYDDVLVRYRDRPAPVRFDTRSIVDRYSDQNRAKVRNALQAVIDSPELAWDKDGNLTRNRIPIAGSNIRDLLDLYVSNEAGDVPGWDLFSRATKPRSERRSTKGRKKEEKLTTFLSPRYASPARSRAPTRGPPPAARTPPPSPRRTRSKRGTKSPKKVKWSRY